MIGALWNGLAGLQSHVNALAVESNNLSNVNTIGHKSDDVNFEDLMYQNGVGKGSTIQSISKKMSQGDIKLTGNTYDVAIEGKGFFILSRRETSDVNYSRAGNFRMASDGLLETDGSLKVRGLIPNAPSIISSDTTTTFTNDYNNFIASKSVENNNFIQTINAKATDYRTSAKTSGLSGDNYKTASAKIADIEALSADYKVQLDNYNLNSTATPISSISQITKVNYTPFISQLDDANDQVNITINNTKFTQVFDTDMETTLKKFSDQISSTAGLSSSVDVSTGLLTITSLIPGKNVTITDAFINTNIVTIDNSQDATLGSGIGMVNSSRSALKTAIENADAKLLDITSTISLLGQESLTLNDIQLKLDTLNIAENTFGDVVIEDGKIYLKDGDNKYIVGKLQTAMFTNEQGLIAQGANLYKNSDESGDAKYAGAQNKVVSSSIELSNASVSTSLTSLLVYQRAFEANSKSITTSDEMLQTAMGLIK
jgi:flagellar hook protein FlgE